jgi:hypothetical protein
MRGMWVRNRSKVSAGDVFLPSITWTSPRRRRGILKGVFWAIGLVAVLSASPASAASITLGLQNYVDGAGIGDFVDFPTVEEAPFDNVCGHDEDGPSCATSWAFALGGPLSVTSASFTVGMLDHDSAAAGDQLAFFRIGGVDLTASLNALLETHGGQQATANIYTLDLPASVLASFLSGSLLVEFGFQNGMRDDGSVTPFNSVAFDFATLEFQPVPEPATILLVGGGAAALVGRRLRSRRRA